VLTLRRRHERAGHDLYFRAVEAARTPWFYAELGVPDTLDGRFDMVGLHAFLVIRRVQGLRPPGPALAQAVFDAMFSDMDMTLRELGVGDLGVGRRIKAIRRRWRRTTPMLWRRHWRAMCGAMPERCCRPGAWPRR